MNGQEHTLLHTLPTNHTSFNSKTLNIWTFYFISLFCVSLLVKPSWDLIDIMQLYYWNKPLQKEIFDEMSYLRSVFVSSLYYIFCSRCLDNLRSLFGFYPKKNNYQQVFTIQTSNWWQHIWKEKVFGGEVKLVPWNILLNAFEDST